MGDDSVWDGNGVSLNKLDTAAPGGNGVEIDRIYYRFPLGDSFTIQAGPLTRNTEMMGYKASACLLYTSPSPRDRQKSRMPSSA